MKPADATEQRFEGDITIPRRLLAEAYRGLKRNYEMPELRREIDRLMAETPRSEIAVLDVPDVCDGKEQEEFEAWAKTHDYDMSQHPQIWLFLDKRTYAAREGWKGALGYARKRVLLSSSTRSATEQKNAAPQVSDTARSGAASYPAILPASAASNGESPDEWYERERNAFIAWWESEGQKKFSDTTTLAAGAGWLARAEKNA